MKKCGYLDVVIYKDISVHAPKFESEKRYWIVSVYSYKRLFFPRDVFYSLRIFGDTSKMLPPIEIKLSDVSFIVYISFIMTKTTERLKNHRYTMPL